MGSTTNRSNSEVLDILFAVALGEGFIAGMYNYKEQLISGDVFTFAETGQGMYRVLLSFLIIILSWLHFRSDTMTSREYPSGEFVVDVLVVMSYMTLFLFVDAPTIYYATITLIWAFYVSARFFSGRKHAGYTLFGLSFVGVFAVLAVSSMGQTGIVAEWSRLALLTLGIVIYRPLDRALTGRLFPS